MNANYEIIDNKYAVNLIGEMDTAAANQVENDLKPLFKSDKDVDIECKGLEYISSSGLRLMLRIQKGASANGCKVTLRNVKPVIQNIFKMTGFSAFFEFK